MFICHSGINRLFNGVRLLQGSKIRCCKASFWGSSADQVVYLRKFVRVASLRTVTMQFYLLSFLPWTFTMLRERLSNVVLSRYFFHYFRHQNSLTEHKRAFALICLAHISFNRIAFVAHMLSRNFICFLACAN